MARPADFAGRDFTPSIFNRIERRIAERGGDVIALHVGDTWFDLPGELTEPLADEPWAEGMSRYGDTQGEVELRRRLAAKLREGNGLAVADERQVQLTLGATGALFAAMRRLLEPGDEVIALAPYWTILRVVAAAAGTRIVEAPFFDRVSEEGVSVESLLAPHLTERTAALYFNNPNNPSGVMLGASRLRELAAFARERDLWVLSDEAYEDFVWSDEPYLSLGSLDGMAERTVSVFSFSKSFAAAGIRLGYAAAPRGAIAALNPGVVGAAYEPPRPAQVMAIRGLERAAPLIGRLREAYLAGRRAALDNLALPHLAADGSFFVFLDLRERWRGLSGDEKIERMLDAGVVLSPGEAFGAAYDGWARLCFTAAPPGRVAEAARRLAAL